MAEYVCNVQTWGGNPSYHQGDLIPEDCPYDVEAAARNRKILPVSEYKAAHPEWDPEAEAKAKAAQAAYPGREVPTAADLPDPKADKAMYEEAAKAEQAESKPVQVQQPSTRSGSTGGSGTSSSRTS